MYVETGWFPETDYLTLGNKCGHGYCCFIFVVDGGRLSEKNFLVRIPLSSLSE
jgi:hypothetical protein